MTATVGPRGRSSPDAHTATSVSCAVAVPRTAAYPVMGDARSVAVTPEVAMESLVVSHVVEHAAPGIVGRAALRDRVSGWMTTSDARLGARTATGGDHPTDRVALAAALREGVSLAVEELRAEEEARLEGLVHAEVALAACRRLLDTLPVALLVTDAESRLREANAVALQLLGLASARDFGAMLVRHVPLDERPAFRQAMVAVSTAAGGWNGDPATEPPPRELPLRLRTPHGPTPVLATVRGSVAGGERLLYWAVREDSRADVGDLL